MQKLNAILKDSYILCLCEGSAEKVIMNMLLDHDKLVFNRDALIQKRVHSRTSVKKTQSKFLNRKFEKQVIILRIIDSRSEQFNLEKAYRDRFSILSCLTKPEIEILIIHDSGEFEEFLKTKSTCKPSNFCKTKLGMSDVKSRKYVEGYFNIDSLINALKTYKNKCKKGHFTIYDLLKS